MKNIFVLIFLLSVLNARGQTLINTTKYYETANIGSVKQITNKEVCAIVFFVSGPENNWTVNNKKSILDRDEKAFKKIEKELKKYDVDFKIHFELFNLNEDFKIDSIVDYKKPLEKEHFEKSIVYKESNAKKIWTYYSNNENSFFKEKKYLSFEGGYFFIMYHEGLGISSSSPALLNGYDERTLPEYLTIFEYDPNWRKTNNYVTVHESLHLFGAWDLYNNSLYGHDKKEYELIRENYPKSIMRLSKQITIDPITAWRIGVNNSPESWFLEMVPKIYHKIYHQKEQLEK
jgi:hypothetical protein